MTDDYPGGQCIRFYHHDAPTDNASIHALFMFQQPVSMYGPEGFSGILREITKATRFAECMSVAPVDFDAPNNILAQAILCAHDDEPSAKRTELWHSLRTLGRAAYFPSASPPVLLRASTPGPVYKKQRVLLDTTPADRNEVRRLEHANTPSPELVAPTIDYARGFLEGLILQAVFDLAPGTDEYMCERSMMLLTTPDWVYRILECEPIQLHAEDEEKDTAKIIATNAVLGCLRVYACAVKPIAKALYLASLDFADAVCENQNTINQLLKDLTRAHEGCRGFEPTLKSFTSMSAEDLENVGIKRPAPKPDIPSPADMPIMLAGMQSTNQLKLVYIPMLRAWNSLREMIPEHGGYVTDWCRIYEVYTELTEALLLARARCCKLRDMMLAERDM